MPFSPTSPSRWWRTAIRSAADQDVAPCAPAGRLGLHKALLCQRRPCQRARGVTALLAAFLLTACTGPGVDHPAIAPGVKDLHGKITAEPTRLELYPEYLRLQLEQRDIDGALDTAKFCIEHNRDDYRAWLLSATAHKASAMVGRERAFVETHDALLRAHQLSSTRHETAEALASFAHETWRPKDERKWREEALQAAPPELVDELRLALASLCFEQGDMTASRETLAAISKPSWSAFALGVKLELVEHGLDAALKKLAEFTERQEPYYALAFRLATSATTRDHIEICEHIFTDGLTNNEAPQIRLTCLFGLWECAWIGHDIAKGRGAPAGADAFAGRIEQVDEFHPEWVTRACTMARATGDDGMRDAMEKRLESMGVAPPPEWKNLRDAVLAWRVEDLRRLSCHGMAFETMRSLCGETNDQQLVAGLATLALDGGKPDDALTFLARLPEPNAQRTAPLRWRALLQDGRAPEVHKEVNALRLTEAPVGSPITLNLFAVTSELHIALK